MYNLYFGSANLLFMFNLFKMRSLPCKTYLKRGRAVSMSRECNFYGEGSVVGELDSFCTGSSTE